MKRTYVFNAEGSALEEVSPADLVMRNMEKFLNNHPEMNTRLLWRTNSTENDLTFWLGVIYGAYTRGVLSISQMQDALLALRAKGMDNDYYKEVLKAFQKHSASAERDV